MKVKDVYEKYKGYSIYIYGRPLEYKEYMTPFSYLPMNTDLGELEVLDIIIDNGEIEITTLTLDLKFKGKEKFKGRIFVYAKEK